ncbi:acyltransferase [Calothrix membranacea FACHB-236]|nr:acyltransferase [Calothrix membranacea FACHB-236]
MSLIENTYTKNAESDRRYELDWLRVLAVLLLIYFHTGAVFYQGELGEFYIKNDVLSSALGGFIFFVHQWHMPLFFFIAGAATWYIFKLRSPQQYISDRFRRLFIPFLFGTLVVVPPQVYYKLLSQQQNIGSYLQFYPQFFHGIRPQGNFEWAHLWFLIYLFTISIVALPLLLFFKTEKGEKWYSMVADFMSIPGAIFLPALPLAVIEGVLRPRWFGFQNLYDDWANVLLYLLYFIYGFLFCADDRFAAAIDKNYKLLLLMAVATMSILLAIQASGILPARGYSWGYIAYQIFRGCNSWCWVMALLALGQRYLRFNHSILQYTSQASYPFYLLHQTVLVAIAFYVVQWHLNIAAKFVIISTTTLIVTGILYEVLVKRLSMMRFLFGLKPKHQVNSES